MALATLSLVITSLKTLRKLELSAYTDKLLCCSVLVTSLYRTYYLSCCVPCALHFTPLANLFPRFLIQSSIADGQPQANPSGRTDHVVDLYAHRYARQSSHADLAAG